MQDKKCRVCEEIKPLDDFSKKTSSKDGYMNICKACDSKKAIKWYYNNSEKVKERKVKYRKNNREYVLQRDRDRYYNDREYVLAQRKEYYQNNKRNIIEKVSEWRKENKEKTKIYGKKNYENYKPKYLAKTAKRKAIKIGATPSWLSEINLAQIQWFYAASKMMTDTTGIPHHVDHIHPIQGSGFIGLHVPWNLRVIKAEENLSKGNKLPTELSHLMWEFA